MEYTIYNQSENKQWNCNLCTDHFAFSDSFFMNSTLSSSYHSEMHNSLQSSLSQNDLSDTNGSLNTSHGEGELCGTGALCILRNEYR